MLRIFLYKKVAWYKNLKSQNFQRQISFEELEEKE